MGYHLQRGATHVHMKSYNWLLRQATLSLKIPFEGERTLAKQPVCNFMCAWCYALFTHYGKNIMDDLWTRTKVWYMSISLTYRQCILSLLFHILNICNTCLINMLFCVNVKVINTLYTSALLDLYMGYRKIYVHLIMQFHCWQLIFVLTFTHCFTVPTFFSGLYTM